MPNENTLSPAVAEVFNQKFYGRPAYIREKAHRVLRDALRRAEEQGQKIAPEFLVAAVDKAIESGAKMPVAYAIRTAGLLELEAAEDRIKGEIEQRKAEPLVPPGASTVPVLGAPIPGQPLPVEWAKAIEGQLGTKFLSSKSAKPILDVMCAVSNGWRMLPLPAVRMLAAGMREEFQKPRGKDDPKFNPFAWAVAQIENTEGEGAVCATVDTDADGLTDLFMVRVREGMRHYRGIPEIARERFLDSVRLQANNPEFHNRPSGEQVVVSIRRLGYPWVLQVWGRWANFVADARRAQEAGKESEIPHPHRFLAGAAIKEVFGEPVGEKQGRFDAAAK